MSIFSRIAIGAANWGKEPYGHRGVVCPRSEQEKIIQYCMSAGIRMLDTAVAYGVDLSWVPTAFEIVTKVGVKEDLPEDFGGGKADILLAHTPEAWPKVVKWRDSGLRVGMSLYDVSDPSMYKGEVFQIPYSPFDRRWEPEIALWGPEMEVHVRSVFCQGKVFHSDEPVFVRFRKYAGELGIPVGTICILFCLLNPHVDKVVIGVDSEEQLRDDLRFFHRLDSFAVEDLNVIDARRWEKKNG